MFSEAFLEPSERVTDGFTGFQGCLNGPLKPSERKFTRRRYKKFEGFLCRLFRVFRKFFNMSNWRFRVFRRRHQEFLEVFQYVWRIFNEILGFNRGFLGHVGGLHVR